MKKYIYHSVAITVFALCAICLSVGIQSCKKSDSVETPKVELSDDKWIDNEVVELPDELEPDDPDDYQAEGVTKVVSMNSSGEVGQFYKDTKCLGVYKYGGAYQPMIMGSTNVEEHDGSFRVVLSSATDSITAITAPNIVAHQIERVAGAEWSFAAQMVTSDYFKAKSVKFTFALASGKTASKSMKTVGMIYNAPDRGEDDEIEACIYPYGTSKYTAYVEIHKLSKSRIGKPEELQNITSAYVPQLGDVVYFGLLPAVITTTPVLKPATKTKLATWAFKIVEANTKCNQKRYLKSVAVADITQIKSADGTTLATKYFRN